MTYCELVTYQFECVTYFKVLLSNMRGLSTSQFGNQFRHMKWKGSKWTVYSEFKKSFQKEQFSRLWVQSTSKFLNCLKCLVTNFFLFTILSWPEKVGRKVEQVCRNSEHLWLDGTQKCENLWNISFSSSISENGTIEITFRSRRRFRKLFHTFFVVGLQRVL